MEENDNIRIKISKQARCVKVELTNKFVEELFFRQMKEMTMRANRKMRSFDTQYSG